MADKYTFPCGCILMINWDTNQVEGKYLCEEHREQGRMGDDS